MTNQKWASNERWAAPPELMRSTPREVQLTAAGRVLAAAAILMLAASVFGGAALWIAAVRGLARAQARDREAVSTQARVVETRTVRENDSRRTEVTYEFLAAGEPYRGKQTLPRREWTPDAESAPVEIRYLPSNPEVNWIAGHEPRVAPAWIAPFVSVPLALGAFFMAVAIRRERNLLSGGRAAAARILASQRDPNGHGGFSVRYEFTMLSGAKRQGSFGQSKRPDPGTVATIIYDPDEPRRQARYPLKLVKAARV